MSPFNLPAALAGSPVCTRDGEPVTQLTLFDAAATEFNLAGVRAGHLLHWKPDGEFSIYHVKPPGCSLNLHMADQPPEQFAP